MIKKGLSISALIFIGLIASLNAELSKPSYKPEGGFVPNAETAIKIALAVWEPIYGKQVAQEAPFHATLSNGIWSVFGTLPKGFTRGGTAEAEISKETGEILRVRHGK